MNRITDEWRASRKLALKSLNIIKESKQPLTTTQISTKVGCSKSSGWRIVDTLKKLDCIESAKGLGDSYRVYAWKKDVPASYKTKRMSWGYNHEENGEVKSETKLKMMPDYLCEYNEASKELNYYKEAKIAAEKRIEELKIKIIDLLDEI